jgi:hypothetical protein
VITDYASLKAEIVSESHRTDLTAKLPDFIQRTEREMARLLPLRAFETTVTGTSTGTITLPADFDQVELLVLNTNGREYPMDYTSPNGVSAYVSGNPNRYTLLNGVIRFIAPTGGEYTLNYLRKLVPLSDAAPTNFIVTEHPDAYLYGAMVQVAMYEQDDTKLGKYAPLFNLVMNQIASQDARKRLPAAGGLQIKPRSYR